MADEILVEAVMEEKTHVGKVAFPAAVPEGLIELLNFPDDLFLYAGKLGLNDHAVKFVLSVLRGKWALTAEVDLQDIAIKTGMKYPEMDKIVCDLIEKNYARLDKRLDLYRLWIVVLHLKDVRFTVE